jgi:hypothetical protein
MEEKKSPTRNKQTSKQTTKKPTAHFSPIPISSQFFLHSPYKVGDDRMIMDGML